MPKIAEIEPTPNPNAMKFVLKEPLTWGVSRSYDSREQAGADKLAAALFDIPNVTNVFYVDHWITVTQDGGASWDDLARKVAVPIREAPAADAQSQAYAAIGAGHPGLDDETLTDEQRGKLMMIADLIDCDVHRIDAADPYPASYDATVARNVREQNTDARPATATGLVRPVPEPSPTLP